MRPPKYKARALSTQLRAMGTKDISPVTQQRGREPSHSLYLVLISILLGDLYPHVLPALMVPR
jgi:hypothetical protein